MDPQDPLDLPLEYTEIWCQYTTISTNSVPVQFFDTGNGQSHDNHMEIVIKR